MVLREPKHELPKKKDFITTWKELRAQNLQEEFADLVDERGRPVYQPSELINDEQAVKKARSGMMTKDTFSNGARSHVAEAKAELEEDIEYILMEAFSELEWFDQDDVVVEPSSVYDDYFNQIDMILTFQTEDKFNHLAIDVTVADANGIVDKERKITDRLSQGKLGFAKYYLSDGEPELNGRKYMPHIVMAMNPAEAQEFRNLIVRANKSKFRVFSVEDKRKLDQYRDQFYTVLNDQLEKYLKYIENLKIGAKFNKLLMKKLENAEAQYKKLVELLNKQFDKIKK